MKPPTWPQLAGWMATAEIEPSRGTATLLLGGDTSPVTCTFAHRPDEALRLNLPDGTVVLQTGSSTVSVAPDGSPDDGPSPLANALRSVVGGRRSSWERSDFHLPVGEVTEMHLGDRLGWQVFLQAPRHKFGPLEFVVDDETGRLLRAANDHPQVVFASQLDRLDLVDVVDDSEFVHLSHRAEDAAVRARQRAEERLALQESLPLVHLWPPGFHAERPWPPRGRNDEPYDPGLVQLHLPNRFAAGHSTMYLNRAQADSPPPDPPGPRPVLRWEADGWAYAMTVDGHVFDQEELRLVQGSIVEREIDG